MRGHDLLRQRRFPSSVMRPAWQLVPIFLTLILLSACSLPFGASPSGKSSTITSTATPTSPLATETVYWSKGDLLFALRASDGHVRWTFGGWTVSHPLPDGNGTQSYIASPSAPTLADGTLYTAVALDHAEAYALAAADGSTRWHVTFPGCFGSVGSDSPHCSQTVYSMSPSPATIVTTHPGAGSTPFAPAMVPSSGACRSSRMSCRRWR